MRMELHRMANDISHLVVLAIIHPLHRVHDAPLHRLKAISNMWHSTLQDYIGSIIQEPILIHLVQMVRDAITCPLHAFRNQLPFISSLHFFSRLLFVVSCQLSVVSNLLFVVYHQLYAYLSFNSTKIVIFLKIRKSKATNFPKRGQNRTSYITCRT